MSTDRTRGADELESLAMRLYYRYRRAGITAPWSAKDPKSKEYWYARARAALDSGDSLRRY
jgi:hypothetical protein